MKKNTAKVLSVSKKRKFGEFYNLQVSEDRSYVVEGGFAVGNCVALDGSRWPVGSVLSDHPSGMAHVNLNQRVYTPCGYKEIGKIREGDFVLSGDGGWVRVVYVHKQNDCYTGFSYDVKLASGTIVSITGEHPFMLIGGEEIRADRLKVGDLVRCFREGSMAGTFGTVRVQGIKRSYHSQKPITILHIQVQEPHTYVCEGVVLHNCVFVPVMKSMEEMGFMLPPDASDDMVKAFHRVERPYPTMKSRFYQMSERDQRKVFGNDLLYNLWRQEKFPLEALVVEKDGMFLPMSFRQAAAKIEELGGVSYPKPILALG